MSSPLFFSQYFWFFNKILSDSSKYMQGHMVNFYYSVYFILWYLSFEANVFQQGVLIWWHSFKQMQDHMIAWRRVYGLLAVQGSNAIYYCWLVITTASCQRATAPDTSCSCNHNFSTMTDCAFPYCVLLWLRLSCILSHRGDKSHIFTLLLHFIF